MIGLCSKCNNLAELYDGLCSICKIEKEANESKIAKNPEAIMKDAFKRLAGIRKEASTVVKEEEK